MMIHTMMFNFLSLDTVTYAANIKMGKEWLLAYIVQQMVTRATR